MTDETRTGRPRDPSRDEAILAATRELLGEAGYERTTVRAIAHRAGAGLATIYRRWPTKEELVVDAVASLPVVIGPRQPGVDPVDHLVAVVTGLVDLLQGPQRELIPTLIGQLPRNPALAETLRAQVVEPRLGAVARELAEVPGVDPARVERAAELIPAAVFFQSLVLGRRVTGEDIRRVVEVAVAAAR